MIIQTAKKEFIASKYVKKIKIKKIFSIAQFLKYWKLYRYCVVLILEDNQEYLYSVHNSRKVANDKMYELIMHLKIEERKKPSGNIKVSFEK
jgi:hypothetical protein